MFKKQLLEFLNQEKKTKEEAAKRLADGNKQEEKEEKEKEKKEK